MYVDKAAATKNGKEYTRYLLRTSKRQGKKTIKTTILNITPFGVETCEAIKFALANKDKLNELGIAASEIIAGNGTLQLTQDKPISVFHILMMNAYYQERNACATFCHRRTRRKHIIKRGIDVEKLHRCKWT